MKHFSAFSGELACSDKNSVNRIPIQLNNLYYSSHNNLQNYFYLLYRYQDYKKYIIAP